MSDLDVALRLRLLNELSGPAKQAISDLKELKTAAESLGQTKPGDLVPVVDVGKAQQELQRLGSTGGEVRARLGEAWAQTSIRLNTEAAEAELRHLGITGAEVRAQLGVAAMPFQLNTEAAETELRHLGATGAEVRAQLGEAATPVKLNTEAAEAELRHLGATGAEVRAELGEAATPVKLNTEAAEAELRHLGATGAEVRAGLGEAATPVTLNTEAAEADLRHLGATGAEVRAELGGAATPVKLATEAAESALRHLGTVDADVMAQVARTASPVKIDTAAAEADLARLREALYAAAAQIADEAIPIKLDTSAATASLQAMKAEMLAGLREGIDAELKVQFAPQTLVLDTGKAKSEVAALDSAVNGLEQDISKAVSDFAQMRADGEAAVSRGRDVAAAQRRLSRQRRDSESADEDPEGRLRRTAGAASLLQSSAAGAWGALVAFAAPAEILKGLSDIEQKFEALDMAATRIAITAEMRDPEVVKRIARENAAAAVTYGMTQDDVTATRQVFTSAGIISPDVQGQVLGPTLKAAKAEGVKPDIQAAAGVALLKNMKVKPEEIPQAYEMMAQGSKIGQFEPEAMARYFAELGAKWAQLGSIGLPGVAGLVSTLEVQRDATGTEGEAKTNTGDVLNALTQPLTLKRYAKQGVDLQKVVADAVAAGVPPLVAVADKTREMVGEDPGGFKTANLYHNQQAQRGMMAILNHRQTMTEYQERVSSGAGAIDKDYGFVSARPAEVEARQSARREVAQTQVGEALVPAWQRGSAGLTQSWESLAAAAIHNQEDRAAIAQKYHEQGFGSALVETLKRGLEGSPWAISSPPRPPVPVTDELAGRRADLSEAQAELAARPAPKFSTGLPDMQADNLRGRIAILEGQIADLQARQAKAQAAPPPPIAPAPVAPAPAAAPASAPIAPMPAISRPAVVPLPHPGQKGAGGLAPQALSGRVDQAFQVAFGPDNVKIDPAIVDKIKAAIKPPLGEAADSSMGEFNAQLQAQGQKSVGIAAGIAAQLKATLSFTAAPTIAPNFSAPAAPAAPAAAAPSAPAGPSRTSAPAPRAAPAMAPTNVTQHFNTTASPSATARYAMREQNRQIRMAQARALHDTGRYA